MDLKQMFEQAQQLQGKVKAMQDELAKLEVVGESGGGLVKITVFAGTRDAKKVEFDPSALKDPSVLADLIAAAINDAHRKVEAIIKEKYGGLAGGAAGAAGGGEPPFDISKLMGDGD